MSRRGPAFSNGTEWEMWSANWCDRCLVDAPYRNDMPGAKGCPLIAVAMFSEVVPDEWMEQPDDSPDRYHCMNFRPPGWRNPEPQPIPDPPDQGVLFDRSEVKGVRMLTTAPSEVRV